MRKSSFAPAGLFVVFALVLPAIIFAQQNRSARRTTDPNRSASTNTPGTRPAPSAPAIKSDLSEALAVIQTNHIDGRNLDYNGIFKSSISGMLSVLDPHSTYFDPAEYAAFRAEDRVGGNSQSLADDVSG